MSISDTGFEGIPVRADAACQRDAPGDVPFPGTSSLLCRTWAVAAMISRAELTSCDESHLRLLADVFQFGLEVCGNSCRKLLRCLLS